MNVVARFGLSTRTESCRVLGQSPHACRHAGDGLPVGQREDSPIDDQGCVQVHFLAGMST
jgi:hypothetical protein